VEAGGGGNIDMDSISVVSSIIGQHTYQSELNVQNFVCHFIKILHPQLQNTMLRLCLVI
jgi:hypothetical protein